MLCFFFFKQKTAYEMRISDWSSDVCSSDLRAVSTERGHDLSEFALYAYGGAGPLHAVEVAEECGIPLIIVPQEPGTMCARGILLGDISFDFVRSEIAVADAAGWSRVVSIFGELRRQAEALLANAGVAQALRHSRSAIGTEYGRGGKEWVSP